jgi:hypothetical protein
LTVKIARGVPKFAPLGTAEAREKEADSGRKKGGLKEYCKLVPRES